MANAIWDTRCVTSHAGLSAFLARADSDNGRASGHHGHASASLMFVLLGASGARLQVLAPAIAASGASGFNTFVDAARG